MDLIISWLIMTFAVWLTAAVLPGFHVRDMGSAFIVAAIFGILNFLLGWLLFALIAVATLGIGLLLAFITRLIVNAILLTVTDKITDRLTIDSFGWSVGGAALISLISTAAEWLLRG